MKLPRGQLRLLLSRLFWLVMLVGHLPATVASLFGEDISLRAGVLLLTESFFVLKLLGVPWLRLPTDRRRLVALIAVFALLHARVVESSLPHDLNSYSAWHVVALVGSLSAAVWVRLARRERVQPQPERGSSEVTRACTAILARRRNARIPPRFLLLLRACRVDRAPPACAL